MRGLFLGLALVGVAGAAGFVTTYNVDFPKGEGRTYTRTLKGEDMHDFLLRKVEEEQKFEISISSTNKACYFDVYDPGAKDARFTGWKEGESFTGRFPTAGTARVRVYQKYDVATRNESGSYTLTIVPGGVPAH